MTAYGINDSGQITGVGLYDGQLTAFCAHRSAVGPAGIARGPGAEELLVLGAGLALIAFSRPRGELALVSTGLGLRSQTPAAAAGVRIAAGLAAEQAKHGPDGLAATWRDAGAGTTPHTAEITDRP